MMGSLTRFGMAGLVVAAAVATPATGQEGSFEWSSRMEPGQVLEVRGITGSVRAELASGNTAVVSAEKHGRRSDFDEVEIRVVEERDGYTVCAVYDWRADEDTCSHGRDDHDDDRSIDVDVEFVVQLPAGVEFLGTMVTGDVEAEGLRSDVTATSVTGDIVVSTTREAWGRTVSGDMDIEMGRIDGDRRFNTVSGDITLRLPADLDADVRFESLSGDLDSDFALDMTRRNDRQWIGSNIRATIGEGGPRLSLETVSGDVRLVRGRTTAR